MTQLVDMLVKNGMAVAEAFEAVADYTEADYLAEVEAEAREAYLAKAEAEREEWANALAESEGYSFDGQRWHCGTV